MKGKKCCGVHLHAQGFPNAHLADANMSGRSRWVSGPQAMSASGTKRTKRLSAYVRVLVISGHAYAVAAKR